jgi:hypothetical protein
LFFGTVRGGDHVIDVNCALASLCVNGGVPQNPRVVIFPLLARAA